jgi:ligand-binding sensor domain-containing protein
MMATPSSGQPSLTEVPFDIRYSEISDGLPQKSILALHQSSLGGLWIGTQEGLHVYTGTRRRLYTYDFTNPKSISSNYITAIAETEDELIFVGTRDAGLNIYNRNTNDFQRLTTSRQNDKFDRSTDQVFSVFVDSKNQVWVGHENAIGRVNKEKRIDLILDSSSDSVNVGSILGFAESGDTIYAVTSRAGLLKISLDGTILDRISIDQMFGNAGSLIQTTGIKRDSNGFLWVWSLEAGIAIVDPANGETVDRVLDDPSLSRSYKRIYDILEVSENNYWIGTQAGLAIYDTEKDRIETTISDIQLNASPEVTKLLRTKDQAIWIGTFHGLFSATPTTFLPVSTLNSSITNDSINAYAEDAQGNIWVGTDNGLNKFNTEGEVVAIYNELTQPSLTQSQIMSLYSESHGLWIGTLSGGLNFLSNDETSVTRYIHNAEDPSTIASMGVTSIIRTSDGDLLVATYQGGLNILEEDTGTF